MMIKTAIRKIVLRELTLASNLPLFMLAPVEGNQPSKNPHESDPAGGEEYSEEMLPQIGIRGLSKHEFSGL